MILSLLGQVAQNAGAAKPFINNAAFHRPRRPYVTCMRIPDSDDLPAVISSGLADDAPAAPAKGYYLNPVIDEDFPTRQ